MGARVAVVFNPPLLIEELHTVLSYATKSAGGGDFRLFVQWGCSKKAMDTISIGWFHYETEDEKGFANSIQNSRLLSRGQVASLTPNLLKAMLPWRKISEF